MKDLAILIRSLSTSHIVSCIARETEFAKLGIAFELVPRELHVADIHKHAEAMTALLDMLCAELDARIPTRGGAA